MDQWEITGQKKKSHLRHGCLSLVSVVCCQVEVSATSWSLVQRSPTDCGVSEICVIMKPRRNEEAQANIRLSSHKKMVIIIKTYIFEATFNNRTNGRSLGIFQQKK
jgi:hypothetical protein